jgi:hypothetical protein
MAKTYYLFISHAWDYSEHYDKIKEWLNEDSISWKDYSVPVTNQIDTDTKKELKEKLTSKISLSSAIIVMSGMYAAYSDWMDYEIDEAIRLGKVIIGVKPWGQERVPTKIQDNATVMVGWNKKSVIDAIKEYA